MANVSSSASSANALSASVGMWWKLFGMWNRAVLAPEYRIAGFVDRAATRASLERVLSWSFDRIVIAHGELVERDAHEVARRAWQPVLTSR